MEVAKKWYRILWDSNGPLPSSLYHKTIGCTASDRGMKLKIWFGWVGRFDLKLFPVAWEIHV